MTEAEALQMVERKIDIVSAKWGRAKEDIAQEIRLQLVRAFRDQWDPQKSKWVTYAVWRIPRMAIDAARGLRLINRQNNQIGTILASEFNAGEDEELDPIEPMDFHQSAEVEDLLDALEADDDLKVIALYVRHGSLWKVGEVLGLSESRISQIFTAIKRDPALRARFFRLAGIPQDVELKRERKPDVLVMTRKKGETIEIRGPSKVVISAIRGDKVRVGVEADRSVVVKRGELPGPWMPPRPQSIQIPLRIAGSATGRRVMELTLSNGKACEAFVGDDRELYVSIDGEPLRSIDLVALAESMAASA